MKKTPLVITKTPYYSRNFPFHALSRTQQQADTLICDGMFKTSYMKYLNLIP